MSLQQEISDFIADFKTKVPADVATIMAEATNQLTASGIAERALKVGEKVDLPPLKNQKGEDVALSGLLQDGPLVLVFYRGGWCPYCNLELRAYQRELADIQAAGASLIAVTPEQPDSSLTTQEKNELSFDVLTDRDFVLSDAFGLTFDLAETLVPIYDGFGINLPAANGEDAWRLPLPATYVIDRDGTVKLAFVDADYTKRLEPSEVIKVLKAL